MWTRMPPVVVRMMTRFRTLQPKDRLCVHLLLVSMPAVAAVDRKVAAVEWRALVALQGVVRRMRNNPIHRHHVHRP
uniref:Putative secreted protein n=1 Tax=Anopheles marajoara TaxID=58244 RepID=A0A2M4CD31_9DIPT